MKYVIVTLLIITGLVFASCTYDSSDQDVTSELDEDNVPPSTTTDAIQSDPNYANEQTVVEGDLVS